MDNLDPGSAEDALPFRAYAESIDEDGWRVLETADELVEVVERAADRLNRVDAAVAANSPAPEKWSVKEIVGHLIDSAANNHQRFIRAQYGGDLVFPSYAQDFWVLVQCYSDSPWPELVELWRLSNRHLARVIRRVPRYMLDVECTIGPYDPVPLGFLIEDYLGHLKHHLTQIDRLLEA